MPSARPKSAAHADKHGDKPARKTDKDLPLIEDIRLLGRILGDVIREQEGGPAYELVEQVRQLSVAFRRDADEAADKALKKLLKGLSSDQTVSVIRAFTYFSHLANLAEDRHHIRRRAVHERAGNTQEGSIEVALARLRWAGISPATVVDTLAKSFISPVLTAHPTEVQRQSILAAERRIAQLLAERDDILMRAQLYNSAKDALTPRELTRVEAQLRARVAQLWQTRLLRHSSSRWPTRSRTPCPITRPPSCGDPQDLRAAGAGAGREAAEQSFCAWANGLAATATATPMSRPRAWSWP
jgi:phosphoenolpyruvate carboxylase